MTTINQLSTDSSLSAGDLVALWSTANGDTRKASLTALAAFLATLSSASGGQVTQYSAPTTTGFTATITNSSASAYLILTPTGTFAAGTILLPALASCVDGQTVTVTCTQIVTTLTVNGNGATVNGAPTTLAANGFFTLKFDGVLKVWYRVG